jgi:hypothetical protein
MAKAQVIKKKNELFAKNVDKRGMERISQRRRMMNLR